MTDALKIIELETELERVRMLLQGCNGDIIKADREIQQLKEALKEYNEATDYSKTYQMWSPTKELDKAYNKARKLIEPNKPEK